MYEIDEKEKGITYSVKWFAEDVISIYESEFPEAEEHPLTLEKAWELLKDVKETCENCGEYGISATIIEARLEDYIKEMEDADNDGCDRV